MELNRHLQLPIFIFYAIFREGMKKVIAFLFLSFPGITYALVPCGPGTGKWCTLADLLVLIDNVTGFLTTIAFPIAILMVVIGGVLMIIAYVYPEGGPSQLQRAKSLFGAVVIGLFIIYAAVFIVELFFQYLGFDPSGGG